MTLLFAVASRTLGFLILVINAISGIVRIEMENSKLSNKIRVVVNRKKIEDCKPNHLQFYKGYASAVSKTLRKPMFQKFLDWIIKLEKIEKADVTDIQVRVFPFEKENGRTVAGRCNSNAGVILLFPKRRSFLKKKLQNNRKEKVHFYLKSRAMAAMIHELLHIKYKSNEGKVRQLTKKYFGIFAWHQNFDCESANTSQRMLLAL
jgi:hypothetical protein